LNLGIENRVAWVAGSSSGIGLAVAEALAGEGARVALGARDAGRLTAAADRIESSTGTRPFASALDMADGASIANWAATCREKLGPAELLFVNAGGPPAGRHEDLDASTWRGAADLILHGAVALTDEVLDDMKRAAWGRLIYLTSVSVRQPIDGLMLSNSLRAAVQGYMRTLATELAPLGITANCLAPGYTATERLGELSKKQAAMRNTSEAEVEADWVASIPAGRLGKPEEIAAAAAFLAGEPAAYLTGQLITVDGGYARSLF
jgi:3-oxoacyl-[acyl-carrier protein] reductase